MIVKQPRPVCAGPRGAGPIPKGAMRLRQASSGRCGRVHGGFSLVELLTVVFIISLLISILIPSLTSARNAAKKARTNTDIKALGTALQLFKNENERDFPQTNGFPPSFSHPPIRGSGSGGESVFDPVKGEFPFVEDASVTPIAYGAHWLPAMLMGVDQLGYVARKNVPPEFRSQPDQWYVNNPGGNSEEPFPRMPFYIEPGGVKTLRTEDLRGRPPITVSPIFPTWEETRHLPVFVDAFDQPILYYAANRHGRKTNMVDVLHNEGNRYLGGPPYYFHVDNWGFTGKSLQSEVDWGWDFGGGGNHPMAEPGNELTADLLMEDDNRKTFARFVLDRTIASKFEEALNESETIDSKAPLLPANPNSFLLISAGIDGRYGTADDITNYPLSVE